MILFNDTTTIEGTTISNALAYVVNCNITSTRMIMEGVVSLSLQVNEPNYAPYAAPKSYYNVPYDSGSEESPAKQFYTYLMKQPEFQGGTQYPPV